jgi:hypothetical protein
LPSTGWIKEIRTNLFSCLPAKSAAPQLDAGRKILSSFSTALNSPVPANYFDDYKTRTRAAHEQEMEIATHMHFGYDLKVPVDSVLEKKQDRVRHCKVRSIALHRNNEKNGMMPITRSLNNLIKPI